LPIVIVRIDMIAKPGAHTSVWWMKPTNMRLSNPANPAALDATDRNAATGIGEPSYVSGAQKWNGTADTLKPNPAMMSRIDANTKGSCVVFLSACAMSTRFVERVTP
jgi:hypothetical protein